MRHSITILLYVVIGVSNSFEMEMEWNSKTLNDEWNQFKLEYHKTYKNAKEELYRKNIFFKNVKGIVEHNKRFKGYLETYQQGVNKFADMEIKELSSIYMNFNAQIMELKMNSNNFIEYKSPHRRRKLPRSINWIERGAVTSVKDQGDCGSCYTFSTIGSVEGQFYKKHKKLVVLSPQELLDCSKSYGNYGCNGGLLTTSFDYIKDRGIAAEKDYPYVGREKSCKVGRRKRTTKIKSYVVLPEGDEKALMEVVASIGPVSTAFSASTNFFYYNEGIFYDPICSMVDINHGVLVVGYETENGTDYWLIKNSYGDKFGMKGYFKLARNRNNHCQIASYASYPVL